MLTNHLSSRRPQFIAFSPVTVVRVQTRPQKPFSRGYAAGSAKTRHQRIRHFRVRVSPTADLRENPPGDGPRLSIGAPVERKERAVAFVCAVQWRRQGRLKATLTLSRQRRRLRGQQAGDQRSEATWQL